MKQKKYKSVRYKKKHYNSRYNSRVDNSEDSKIVPIIY